VPPTDARRDCGRSLANRMPSLLMDANARAFADRYVAALSELA